MAAFTYRIGAPRDWLLSHTERPKRQSLCKSRQFQDWLLLHTYFLIVTTRESEAFKLRISRAVWFILLRNHSKVDNNRKLTCAFFCKKLRNLLKNAFFCKCTYFCRNFRKVCTKKAQGVYNKYINNIFIQIYLYKSIILYNL